MSTGEIREQQLTDDVIASFDSTPSPRLREVMQSLVRHLHDFATDVRLTHEEWQAGIDFLTQVGEVNAPPARKEFVLLSDVLGLSMLTVNINAPEPGTATEETVLGPFFVDDIPEIPLGGDITRGAKGTPCYVSGTVRSTTGVQLPGAHMVVWEADADGFYDVHYGAEHRAARGQLRVGEDGAYRFWSVLPSPYPIPYDGPVGKLLETTQRGHMRPCHLHYKVSAPGHRTLITHIFLAGDPYIETDAVFGVKESLITAAVQHPAGTAPDGTLLTEPYHTIAFDIVLAPQP